MSGRQPFNISFNKKQIEQLAQTIMTQYSLCFEQEELPRPRNLLQAFLMIISTKNQQINILQQSLAVQLNRNMQDCFANNYEHIAHEPQQIIDSLNTKDLKILSRVIDLKNQKVQQLLYLSKKYDALLEQFRKLKQKQSNLQIELSLAKQQIKNNQIQITRLNKIIAFKDNQLKQTEQKIISLNKQMEEFRVSFEGFKLIIGKTYSDIYSTFSEQIKSTITKYSYQIKKLYQFIQKQQNQLVWLRKQKQQQRTRYAQIIKFLVNQLSKAVKFERKQAQSDQIWIKQYQKFVHARDRRQKEKLGPANVHMKPKLSTAQFINKYKQFLEA